MNRGDYRISARRGLGILRYKKVQKKYKIGTKKSLASYCLVFFAYICLLILKSQGVGRVIPVDPPPCIRPCVWKYVVHWTSTMWPIQSISMRNGFLFILHSNALWENNKKKSLERILIYFYCKYTVLSRHKMYFLWILFTIWNSKKQ